MVNIVLTLMQANVLGLTAGEYELVELPRRLETEPKVVYSLNYVHNAWRYLLQCTTDTQKVEIENVTVKVLVAKRAYSGVDLDEAWS